jgi:hypothetical protein
LEKWARKWDRGNTGGQKGWVGPLRRKVSNDRYHCDQGKKGNLMGYMTNKGARKGVGTTKKNCVKNDRYHWNQGEERNPMGYFFFFFTPMDLYSDMKNIVVLKCPNY